MFAIRRHFRLCILLTLACLLETGCDVEPTRPDIGIEGPIGFCVLEPVTAPPVRPSAPPPPPDYEPPVIGNRLIVQVKNNSTSDVPSSLTRVRFFWAGAGEHIEEIPTPPIGAVEMLSLPSIPFPSLCFDPDCDFEISVDAGTSIDEDDETNNSVVGMCPG